MNKKFCITVIVLALIIIPAFFIIEGNNKKNAVKKSFISEIDKLIEVEGVNKVNRDDFNRISLTIGRPYWDEMNQKERFDYIDGFCYYVSVAASKDNVWKYADSIMVSVYTTDDNTRLILADILPNNGIEIYEQKEW